MNRMGLRELDEASFGEEEAPTWRSLAAHSYVFPCGLAWALGRNHGSRYRTHFAALVLPAAGR